VREEQKKKSDLDLLVEFDELPSLLGFIALENYLTDILGVKVDLVMEDTLKPPLDTIVLQEAIPV
jgi:predicted nucleotidyltransferase